MLEQDVISGQHLAIGLSLVMRVVIMRLWFPKYTSYGFVGVYRFNILKHSYVGYNFWSRKMFEEFLLRVAFAVSDIHANEFLEQILQKIVIHD